MMAREPLFDHEVERWDGLYRGERGWAFFSRAASRRVRERQRVCLEWLNPSPGEIVLDLGCGPGRFRPKVVEKGARWIGLDMSFEMLRALRESAPPDSSPAWAAQGDAQAIPLSDEGADACLVIGVMNYYRQPEVARILAEVARVLRPGGRVVLSNLRLDVLTWLRSRLPGWTPRPLRIPGPIIPHAPQALERLLADTGFRLVRRALLRKYLHVPYLTLIEAEKM